MYLEFLVYITKSFIAGSKKQGSSTYLQDTSKVKFESASEVAREFMDAFREAYPDGILEEYETAAALMHSKRRRKENCTVPDCIFRPTGRYIEKTA